jgi:four helix bundle protein
VQDPSLKKSGNFFAVGRGSSAKRLQTENVHVPRSRTRFSLWETRPALLPALHLSGSPGWAPVGVRAQPTEPDRRSSTHQKSSNLVSADRKQPLLDHERLDVYKLALSFRARAMQLVCRRGIHHLRDQLERASLGIVLCLAEVAGRASPKDKRRFYTLARGSATESAAILDVLRIRSLAPVGRCRQARAMVVRLVQMLTRLSSPKR